MRGVSFHKGIQGPAFSSALSNAIAVFLLSVCCVAGADDSKFPLSGIDAVYEKDSSLIVFKFSNWSYAKLDPLQKKRELQWKSLLRPEYNFIPRKILAGQNNNFLVFDLGGKKIWQLSSEMQFLTHYPLPEELLRKNLSEMQILFALDYKFYFIFPYPGRAYQYHISGRKLQFVRDFKVPGECREFFPMPFKAGRKLESTKAVFGCRTEKNIKLFDAFLSPVSSGRKVEASLFRYNLGNRELCYHVKEGRLEICADP